MRLLLSALVLVTVVTTRARAEDASCPGPPMRDKAPLLRGIDEDKSLGYILDRLVNCLRAQNPYGIAPPAGACESEREACRKELEHHNQTLADHDESPFVGDIEGGWLGQSYTPINRSYAAPVDDTFSCDETEPEKLARMSLGRVQIAIHHSSVLSEWDAWWSWANSVARSCRSATLPAPVNNHDSGGGSVVTPPTNGGEQQGSGATTPSSPDSTGSAEEVEQSTIGQAAAAGEAIDTGIALAAKMHGRGTIRFFGAFALFSFNLPRDADGAFGDDFSVRRYHWLRSEYDLGIEYGLEAVTGGWTYQPPKLGSQSDDDFFATLRPQASLWWHAVGVGAFVDWNAATFNDDARGTFVPGLKGAVSLGGVARRAYSVTLSMRSTFVDGRIVPAFRALAHVGIVNFLYEWQRIPTTINPDGSVQLFGLGFGVVQ